MGMLLRIKTLLGSLILPPAGPLLLAAVGVFLIERRPRWGRVCLLLALGSLWLLSTPVVSDALTGLAESYPPLDLRNAAGAQAIVVLGGGGQRAFAPEYGGPAAGPLLLERLSYGAYLARRTGLPILVTGFGVEAAAMRETLSRNFEIDPRWVDDQAYDTFENARNSVRLLEAGGIHRVILVNHSTHMRRSVHEFTAAGVEVAAAPVGLPGPRRLELMSFVPNADALLRAHIALHELIGEPVREFLEASHWRRH
jgi:uncharacterized SAM-binding protein YcdF (DUF218 family)